MVSNMLDIKQTALYLNVSVSLIRKLVRKSEIPHNRIGNKLLFRKDKIDSGLKENQNECENERRNY